MIYNPTCILVVVVGWWLVVCNQWYICICVHQLTPASGVHMNCASDFSCKNKTVLVIFSCIFWQIVVLQGLTNGNVTRSTNVNLSSLTNDNIPNMTDANLTKLFVSGCTWVIQKNRLRSRDAQILVSLCIRVFYLKPSCLLWEALDFEKHIPKPAPNGTKNLPRHVDAAPW